MSGFVQGFGCRHAETLHMGRFPEPALA